MIRKARSHMEVNVDYRLLTDLEDGWSLVRISGKRQAKWAIEIVNMVTHTYTLPNQLGL